MNGIDLALMSMEQDADAATDQILFRDNITWSKARLKRAKVMSMITGRMYYIPLFFTLVIF